jgi:hypothetical protein
MKRGRPSRPLAEAFWAFVSRKGPDECWLWTGQCGRRDDWPRYAIYSVGKRVQRTAARVAFELTHGVSLERGVFVLQTCRNRYCCNPAHLYARPTSYSKRAVNSRIRRRSVAQITTTQTETE